MFKCVCVNKRGRRLPLSTCIGLRSNTISGEFFILRVDVSTPVPLRPRISAHVLTVCAHVQGAALLYWQPCTWAETERLQMRCVEGEESAFYLWRLGRPRSCCDHNRIDPLLCPCVCVCLCVVLHLFVQYRSSHHSTPGLSLLSWQPLFLPHHFRINLIAEVCLSSSSTGDKCRGRRDEWTDEWLLTFIDRGVLSPSCFFFCLWPQCVCVCVCLTPLSGAAVGWDSFTATSDMNSQVPVNVTAKRCEVCVGYGWI